MQYIDKKSDQKFKKFCEKLFSISKTRHFSQSTTVKLIPNCTFFSLLKSTVICQNTACQFAFLKGEEVMCIRM